MNTSDLLIDDAALKAIRRRIAGRFHPANPLEYFKRFLRLPAASVQFCQVEMNGLRRWKQPACTFRDLFGFIYQLSLKQDGTHGREQSFTYRRMVYGFEKLRARFAKSSILKISQGDQRGKTIQHFRRASSAPMQAKV